jgi:hypothetical protein
MKNPRDFIDGFRRIQHQIPKVLAVSCCELLHCDPGDVPSERRTSS